MERNGRELKGIKRKARSPPKGRPKNRVYMNHAGVIGSRLKPKTERKKK
jgi:hypothetical protein